ncbi:DMT family transporter [uncultured Parvimonas sp.]|uniref:DMT family transporter n=1 Tax=uncultured Parvimonas sp. TaxID=747372 RepID=UPI002596CE5B|nr:DMT family transporter [uncultured Parvimonas sp.]
MNFIKGIIFTIISAFVFGIIPIFAKITYAGGSNAITLTFLRALFGIPFLYIGVRKNKVSLKISKSEFFQFIILSFLGIGITIIALYLSYSYISVGMATTLHFLYPCIVYFICILFFKEKITLLKLLALVFSMIGTMILVGEVTGSNLFGIFLATLSGVTYSLFLIYLDKSKFKYMDPFKCNLYISLFNVVGFLAFGMAINKLTFSISTTAWFLSILIAFLSTIFGKVFLQYGVKYCGATTASVLGTFEPITSVFLGILFLGESINISKFIGSSFIIFATILLFLNKELNDELKNKIKVEE